MIRRLLIRPGAIGDFVLSLPALEALRADYTEVWCAAQNVPLARFADLARSISAVGLDRLGFLPADDVIEKLRSFDSIWSWYGANRREFRELTAELGLNIEFRAALPDGASHAVDFYNSQVGRSAGRFPRIECPPRRREFAAIHPFASSAGKRAPMELFEGAAEKLARAMPVRWLHGPEETLCGAIYIPDLYDLACWLRGASIFVGNDSGISHLAAAVGTPVVTFFRTTEARVWSPRGDSLLTHMSATGER